jgi:predicted acylesterase/phospholipase RssA
MLDCGLSAEAHCSGGSRGSVGVGGHTLLTGKGAGPKLLAWPNVFALVCLLLALGACAAQTRLSAVPAKQTARASIPGFPDARIFAYDTAGFIAQFEQMRAREAQYFRSVGRPLPPENVLALSGGGDDAAFGAGLLVGLSESGKRPPFKVVTGISAGALIAPFAFLGPEYDSTLKNIFANLHQNDIYNKRPILAAFVSDALTDTAPLKKLIATYLDEQVVQRIAQESRRGRGLFIISTDLDAGVAVVWNIGAIAESGRPQALALIRQILLASAAIPGEFPPVMFDVTVDGVHHQEMHVDGGAINQTFLYPPAFPVGNVDTAIEPGRTHTAYIIRNERIREDWSQVERSTLPIALRAVDTLTISSGLGDLYAIYALARRDGFRFRLAFISDDFNQPHPDDFDHNYMTKLFEYGRARASNGNVWQNAPPGF